MLITPEFPEAIDNTMRKQLVKCETAAKYRFEWGLKALEDERVDLHAGAAFAKGMEEMRRAYFVERLTEYDAIEKGISALYKKYGNFACPSSSNKSAERMAGALTFYAEQRPLSQEDLEPIRLSNDEYGLEISFAYPIAVDHPSTNQPLLYCGRFDMLALHKKTNMVWIVDEKTGKSLGDKWANQWQLDSQMTGYCWGARKLLDSHNMGSLQIAGAIINGIAIKKYDYEHVRVAAYREAWEVQRWYEQLVDDVLYWKTAHQSGKHRFALDHACAYYNNPCEYSKLCKSRNPERILDGNYVVERWKPLVRHD